VGKHINAYCRTLACRQLAAGYQSRHKKPVEPDKWPHGFSVSVVLDFSSAPLLLPDQVRYALRQIALPHLATHAKKDALPDLV